MGGAAGIVRVVPDPDVIAFLRDSLPAPPARLLEVGAGSGEVASILADDGYEVVAVDPSSKAPDVLPITLLELDRPPASFDAALAVVALHHVEPLAPSCERLARLVRVGGTIVVDEFDVEALDERAAAWWLDQWKARGDRASDELTSWRPWADGEPPPDPAALVDDRRSHLHTIDQIRAALAPWFELTEPVYGPYLYRWRLPPGYRAVADELIDAGRLPVIGARFVGRRR